MTTSPVISITDELIAELERECRAGADDHAGMGHEEESALFDRIGDVLLALMAERAELLRKAEVLQLYAPIIDEIDRRAGKQHCIQDQCDFTVTISYEDYAAIAAYDDAQRVKP